MKLNQEYEALEVQYKIFANLFRVANKLQVTMDRGMEEITAKQWFLLAALSYMEEPPTLKELAEAVDYSHQNVRQLINKLEAKGFVVIERDDQDQRAIRILLTDNVKEWEVNRHTANQEFIVQMYHDISQDDLLIAGKVLNQLYDNLGGIV